MAAPQNYLRTFLDELKTDDFRLLIADFRFEMADSVIKEFLDRLIQAFAESSANSYELTANSSQFSVVSQKPSISHPNRRAFDAPRAGSAAVDGRGAVQGRDRPQTVPDRQYAQGAHQLDLRQTGRAQPHAGGQPGARAGNFRINLFRLPDN